MKVCYKCKEEKPLEDFSKNVRNKDGLQSDCKACRRQHQNSYRREKSAKVKPKEVCCAQCSSVVKVGSGRVPRFCSTYCKTKYHSDSQKRVDWINNNIDKRMYYRCKNRAKTLGIPFDLTLEDCEVPEFCPVLGVKLEYKKGQGYNPHTPSIDKIIPEKGYVKGNVRVISWKANLIKNDATLEELRLVYENYRQILEEVSFEV